MFETSETGPYCIMQAQQCRRHAADLDGKPEASILLRIAGYFKDLSAQSASDLTKPDCLAWGVSHSPATT
jgi:hypothetical protein